MQGTNRIEALAIFKPLQNCRNMYQLNVPVCDRPLPVRPPPGQAPSAEPASRDLTPGDVSPTAEQMNANKAVPTRWKCLSRMQKLLDINMLTCVPRVGLILGEILDTPPS